MVLEAKLNLVPLPKAKSVLAIQFQDTLEALAATPVILQHRPSAVEIMDKFILDHTKQSPALRRDAKSFVQGDPGALLCVEFYDETPDNLPPRMEALEQDLRGRGFGYSLSPRDRTERSGAHLESCVKPPSACPWR